MPSETPPGAAWRPDWTASPRVGALMSTRQGGVSAAPWDSLNLGIAVGDDPLAVAENRRRFTEALGARPVWLRQVHGITVLRLQHGHLDAAPVEADAAWTDEPGLACTVQVADCLPVLMAAPEGRAVAAAHAGWRGLAGGVVEAALAALCEGAHCAPQDVAVWLGPCIGPRQFEVGDEVLQAFGASPADPDPEPLPGQRAARRHGALARQPAPADAACACNAPACTISTVACGAPSKTGYVSSRTGVTGSPGAWLPRSSFAAEACARSRARRRIGAPITYSTIDSGSTP